MPNQAQLVKHKYLQNVIIPQSLVVAVFTVFEILWRQGLLVYCHGIGNGRTELFNENKSNYLFNNCLSHMTVYQAY